jgi:hypothetical protein
MRACWGSLNGDSFPFFPLPRPRRLRAVPGRRASARPVRGLPGWVTERPPEPAQAAFRSLDARESAASPTRSSSDRNTPMLWPRRECARSIHVAAPQYAQTFRARVLCPRAEECWLRDGLPQSGLAPGEIIGAMAERRQPRALLVRLEGFRCITQNGEVELIQAVAMLLEDPAHRDAPTLHGSSPSAER